MISIPVNDTHIELQPILNPLPDISEQLSSQIIQEVLKPSGVDFSKFKCYKHHKVQCHNYLRLTKITLNKITKCNFFLPAYQYNVPLWLKTRQPGHANQELLPKSCHIYFGISSVMVYN